MRAPGPQKQRPLLPQKSSASKGASRRHPPALPPPIIPHRVPPQGPRPLGPPKAVTPAPAGQPPTQNSRPVGPMPGFPLLKTTSQVLVSGSFPQTRSPFPKVAAPGWPPSRSPSQHCLGLAQSPSPRTREGLSTLRGPWCFLSTSLGENGRRRQWAQAWPTPCPHSLLPRPRPASPASPGTLTPPVTSAVLSPQLVLLTRSPAPSQRARSPSQTVCTRA